MRYRRIYVAGGTYFFTVVTAYRRKILIDNGAINILWRAFVNVMEKWPFEQKAIVILPDHLHCIWTLPENDSDFSTRWRLIKTHFTKDYNTRPGNLSKDIWQKRYWEHWIRDNRDYRNHFDYIHYNPVKHGYVSHPIEWPHSTFRHYVANGTYPISWSNT